MKTINIYKVAICSFIGLAFAACANVDEYTPAPQEDPSITYVRVDQTAPRNLDIDGSDILVPLVRTNASGTLDVKIELSDTSSIFTLASTTVSFAEGDSIANASISYSYDDLDPAAVYAISVAITEGPTSEYSPVVLPISCKKAWQNLGEAQFYDDWWVGGPMTKTLLKAPDGTETYRLLNPWDKTSVVEGGLTFVSELPYLEFVLNEDGTVSYSTILDMGFTFNGMTCHMIHPSALGDAASSAQNVMVDENVVQFCWYPILNYNPATGGFSWWGSTAKAFISFPGGPDLSEYLGLE